MALEATHIRFALDLKDKYRIKDLKRYIVGTVYPDSRYITQIDRLLTHPVDYPDWQWETADDFKKGWLVHLLADQLQRQITKEKLPQIFEGETGQGSKVWIQHTAIKILQDLDDVKRFDIEQYLPYLEFTENPNGEDFDKVNKYNQIFIKMYAKPSQVNINSLYEMWKKFGISDDLANKIKNQAEQYSEDKSVMVAVREIYCGMLSRIKNR